jgi:hypothetical protein
LTVQKKGGRLGRGLCERLRPFPAVACTEWPDAAPAGTQDAENEEAEMSNEKFQGVYQASDGYVGKDRPKYFTVSADDLEEDMTDAQLYDLYEEAAYEDFLQNVSCDTSRCDEFVLWAKAAIAKRDSEGDA